MYWQALNLYTHVSDVEGVAASNVIAVFKAYRVYNFRLFFTFISGLVRDLFESRLHVYTCLRFEVMILSKSLIVTKVGHGLSLFPQTLSAAFCEFTRIWALENQSVAGLDEANVIKLENCLTCAFHFRWICLSTWRETRR